MMAIPVQHTNWTQSNGKQRSHHLSVLFLKIAKCTEKSRRQLQLNQKNLSRENSPDDHLTYWHSVRFNSYEYNIIAFCICQYAYWDSKQRQSWRSGLREFLFYKFFWFNCSWFSDSWQFEDKNPEHFSFGLVRVFRYSQEFFLGFHRQTAAFQLSV